MNVSSTFGQKAAAALSHYAASKAALEHMTRCWALEFAEHRIRVNAVAAAPTKGTSSPREWVFPMNGRNLLKPRSGVAFPWEKRITGRGTNLIVALASDSRAWITGQVITVDGGLSIS